MPDPSRRIYISPEIQNCFHMPLFGVLAFLWMRAFKYNEWRYRDAVFHTIAICVIYGALTEFYQNLIPGRYPSMIDFIFNCVGTFLGTIVYRYK